MIPFVSERYTFRLRAEERIQLPPYKGAAFRGGFGYAFRKVVCALKRKPCDDCLLKARCVYAYIFETPPPSGTKVMRKYTRAPHPFVIEPPADRRSRFEQGEIIPFEIILIGKAVEYLPYFIYTFETLGGMGIGRERGKYHLESVRRDEVKIYDGATKTLTPVPPGGAERGQDPAEESGADRITLEFVTPTRILYNKHLTVDLEFHILVRNLLRRIALLSCFHCGGNPDDIDFRALIRKAESVKVRRRNLRWVDWERYSTRQKTRMKLGGFIGKVIFEGDLMPFIPYIRIGEDAHVGKATSFGLGKYEIIR